MGPLCSSHRCCYSPLGQFFLLRSSCMEEDSLYGKDPIWRFSGRTGRAIRKLPMPTSSCTLGSHRLWLSFFFRVSALGPLLVVVVPLLSSGWSATSSRPTRLLDTRGAAAGTFFRVAYARIAGR